jgi:hypothetical protein
MKAGGPTVAECLDVSIDRSASGGLTQWWRCADVAISAVPYLNPNRSDFQKVSILTPIDTMVDSVRQLLRAAGYVDMGSLQLVSSSACPFSSEVKLT